MLESFDGICVPDVRDPLCKKEGGEVNSNVVKGQQNSCKACSTVSKLNYGTRNYRHPMLAVVAVSSMQWSTTACNGGITSCRAAASAQPQHM